MMSPRVTAMSATSLSPKWSRLRSICRSIGDRSPTLGASPSWLSITSSIWLRSVASLSSPNSKVRRPRQKLRPLPSAPRLLCSAIRLGLHLQIGIGDAERGERFPLDPLHRLGFLLAALMVVTEKMERAVDNEVGGMIGHADAFRLGFAGADVAGKHYVA